MSEATRWLPLFKRFVADLRISSKEESSADGCGTPLVLWESQSRFLSEVAEGLDRGVRTFHCLKSRQLGVTSISLAIDIFWLAMHPGITGALVTEDEGNKDKNRKVLKQYVDSFPANYFGYEKFIVQDNRSHMLFANGSRLDFKVAGTKKKSTSWGEGEGYAFAHLTECAAYGDIDGLRSFEESFAQINPNRLFVYESTAKGFGLWREKWLSAFSDPLTKHSFFVGWWASATNRIELNDPRFAMYGLERADKEEREKIKAVRDKYQYEVSPEQLAWYRWREATDEAGSDMLSQNQPWTAEDAFITSGQSFFQTRVITQDLKRLYDDLTLTAHLAYAYDFGDSFFNMQLRYLDQEADDHEIELRVWEEPVREGKYVIGCDPAYGRTDHKDAIAIAVWRCYADKLVQCAEYVSSQTEVKYAAWVLAHLGGAYGDCIVNVELGGGGRIIMNEWDHIKGLLNSEMYTGRVKSGDWEDALDQARWYLYSRPDSMGAGYAYNFETTWRTKQELMHGLRGAYVTRELEIRSTRLLNEMSIVVQDGSTIGAPESRSENSKDDRVFATAFAHRAWVNWRRPEMIANGDSYEAVSKLERGEITMAEKSINGMVHRFFRNQAVIAAMPPQLSWRQERGLD